MNIPLSNEELTKLNDYLGILTGSKITNMNLLNGFLVSVVCSQKPILPHEFMLEIMPNEDMNAKVKECIALIIRHWANIYYLFDRGHNYQAVLPSNDICSIYDWTDGFVKGISLNMYSWMELLNDDQHGRLLAPMLFTEHQDKYRPITSSSPKKAIEGPVTSGEDIDQVIALISTNVQNIYNYFKLRKTQDSITEN